jgi:FKBP-type peptidyl-prolyl cis-trans isomerase SlyD
LKGKESKMSVNQIADGVVVSLAYVLTVDGEEVGRASADEPLDYLHGAENVVPGLESALLGKHVGDRLSVTIPPEDGYGDYDEEEIDEFDREELDGAEDLEMGMLVEIADDEGYIYVGTVMEITEESVLVDFNPPFAGKTLNFDVQVLALREATAEERDHGHPHSPDYDDED